MISTLSSALRYGLMPLLLIFALLGGAVAEAATCAGEPGIEITAVADASDRETGDGDTEARADACQHGHFHHGQALLDPPRAASHFSKASTVMPARMAPLSQGPPGSLERPPRI